MKESYRSVKRTMEILECLARNPNGLEVSKVAKETGLDKSTAYRFLSSLVDVGAVRLVPPGRYRLSWKMFEMGSSLLVSQGIDYKAIYPLLESLSSSTGQSTNMAVIDGWEIVYVAAVNSQGIVQTVFRVGGRLPAYCTALGKAILAHYDAEQVDQYVSTTEFAPYTEYTVVNREAFMKELKTTRERGFAVQKQEFLPGVYCLAAPVFRLFDEPFASIGVSGHSDVFLRTPASIEDLLTTARQISEMFGASKAMLSYFDRCLEECHAPE